MPSLDVLDGTAAHVPRQGRGGLRFNARTRVYFYPSIVPRPRRKVVRQKAVHVPLPAPKLSREQHRAYNSACKVQRATERAAYTITPWPLAPLASFLFSCVVEVFPVRRAEKGGKAA